MATIDRYYFRVCTDGARRRGLGVEALLRAAGVEPADLEVPGWRGDVEAMARLVRGICAALGDEFMGFTRHPMPLGAFAFACGLAREASSVGAGLRRAIRFYNLANRDIHTSLDDQGHTVVVTCRFAEPERDPAHYFGEFWLIIWHRLACWLAGETVPMLEATLDYPKPAAYFAEFKHLFPCPHQFNAPHRAIWVDGGALDQPVRRTEEELAVMLARAPIDILTIPASDLSLAPQVRRLLTETPGAKLTDIAIRLRLAPDVVRRRLRQEGCKLSDIREDVRRFAAIRALTHSGRSIDAISAELGYAEPRSFTRAFRIWTGSTPSSYRSEALQARRSTPD